MCSLLASLETGVMRPKSRSLVAPLLQYLGYSMRHAWSVMHRPSDVGQADWLVFDEWGDPIDR
jgi:hypothetical protein